MDWKNILIDLVPVIGQGGVDLLSDHLKDVAGGLDEPWKKTILGLVTNALDEFGPEGLEIVRKELTKLAEGKEIQLDWADLEVASDMLALLQNAEADEKNAARDFFVKLSADLGAILTGLLKGILGSI